MMGPKDSATECASNSTPRHQHSSTAGNQIDGQEKVAPLFPWQQQQQQPAAMPPSAQGGGGNMAQGTGSRLLVMAAQTEEASAYTAQPAAATAATTAPMAWAPPLDLWFAEPWCIPITTGNSSSSSSSSRQGSTGSDAAVHLMHLSWRRPSRRPDAASAPQPAAAGSQPASTGPSLQLSPSGALQAARPAAAAQADDSFGSSHGSVESSSEDASDHSSCSGQHQPAAPTELYGLLFDGPMCVADYQWPLPAMPDSSTGGYITAALQLPAALEPQVLQLVLCCDVTRHDGQESKRIAFARCPVMYLPPAAVQEVQQLLLPAMQQEVLEGWAVSQAGATTAGAAAEESPGSMPLPLLQAAVWQHWQALADDLGLVLGLQQRLARQQDNMQQQAQWQAAAVAAAATADTPSQRSNLDVCMGQQEQAQADYVQHQLLPVVQGYLASQGLVELQGVVQRAAAAWQLAPTLAQDTGQPRGGSHTAAGVAAAGTSPSSSSSSLGGSSKVPVRDHQREQQQQQQQCASPADPSMWAATCWTGFPSHLEQQYVAYKHQQYLWLDRYAACFAVLWVCVLLARMALERDVRGSAMYLGYILSKAVPYFTLLAGHVACFQRQREVGISLVSQVLCLAPIVVGALLVDPRITPHVIQGASWAMDWLRVFIPTLVQRLWAITTGAWPQLLALQQVPAWQQAAGAVVAIDAAANGFPAAALQLHQQLAQLVVLPERPMRIFWRIHGEYLVLVPMAIPQHVRLWFYVPSMLAEVAGNCYVFSWVFPWWQVVLRFTPALLLTIGVAWWFDYQARAKFLHHLQQQAAQQEQRLEAKLRGLGCIGSG